MAKKKQIVEEVIAEVANIEEEVTTDIAEENIVNDNVKEVENNKESEIITDEPVIEDNSISTTDNIKNEKNKVKSARAILEISKCPKQDEFQYLD